MLAFWPFSWFYIKAVTCENPWRFAPCYALHLIPSLIGLAVRLIALTHQTTITVVFGEASLEMFNALVVTVALLIFLSSLAWFIQMGVYVLISLNRLFRYRSRLKDVFATTEGSELNWQLSQAIALRIFWVLSVLDIFETQGFWTLSLENIVNIGLMLMLALWSVRQCPAPILCTSLI